MHSILICFLAFFFALPYFSLYTKERRLIAERNISLCGSLVMVFGGKPCIGLLAPGYCLLVLARSVFLQSQFKELIHRMFKYKETYKAACSECGQEWQISAEQDANKPIYCQECYWKRRQLGEFEKQAVVPK